MSEELGKYKPGLRDWDRKIVAMQKALRTAEEALQECADYFEPKQDVNWEGDGPNTEMSLHTEVQQALAAIRKEMGND